MTREEMLKWLEQIEKDIYVCSLESTFADDAKSCAIHEAIEALEQEPKWIPVSEGLPEKTGWYLITFKTANRVAVCELSYRKPENYWTDKDISKKVFDNNDVIAWMPLPKPYEVEE